MPSFPPESPRPEDLIDYDVPVSLSRRLNWQTLATNETDWSHEHDMKMAYFGPYKDRLPIELVALQERTANLIRMEKELRTEIAKSAALLKKHKRRIAKLEAKDAKLKAQVLNRKAKVDALRSELRTSQRETRAIIRAHKCEIDEERAKVSELNKNVTELQKKLAQAESRARGQ